MKKLLLVLLALVGLPQAYSSSASFSKSLSAVDSAITMDARGYNSVSFQLTGTWVATVKFEGTVNGTTWTTVFSVNQKGGAVDSVATANGVYLLSGNGFQSIRARVSARTSGTITVQGLANEGSGVVSLLNQTSGGAATNVAVTSSALPTGAATATNQTSGSAKSQIVDGSGNVIGATSNALDVNIKSGSSSGAVAQGSTTSGQTGSLTQAAVTTAAPTYTTGQTSPLSLTTGGALRVDASGQTLTVGSHNVTNAGTFATQAAQSGTWNITNVSGTVSLPTGAATAANQSTEITSLSTIAGSVKAEDAAHTSTDPGVMALAVRRDANTTLADATGDYAPLQVDASGSLKVAITAGAGSGGTSIADDAAFTTASTSTTPAAGVYNSTLDLVDDGDAGALAMTQRRALMVNLRDNSGNEVSVGGGTQYDDDAVYGGDGSKVTMAGVVRRDANTTLAGTDGDVAPLQVNAAGQLKVDGSANTQPVSGTITANAGTGTFAVSAASLPLPSGAATAAKQPALGTAGSPSTDVITVQGSASGTALPVSLASVPSHAVTNAGTFAVQATVAAGATTIGKAEDVASADADVGVPAMAIRQSSPANTSGTNGDWEALQINAGRLWTSATIDAALPAGSNVIGALTANQSVNVAQINGVTPLMGNGVTGTGSQRVTIASDQTAFSVNATAVGQAAHDAAIAGNPVRMGARAVTSDYTAVQTGDQADLISTIDGKQVFKPHAVRGATWTYAAASGGLTTTTAATMKTASGAGVRNCLTGIQVINGHATVSTEVVVRDGAAGTVVWRGFAQAAGGGAAANFDVPICGTANTLMEVANITTGSAVYVNAQGYTSQE